MKEAFDIAIDQIKPNKYQPRKEFNVDALFELAQSIRENGLIQPIVVRKQDVGYEIIAGERRYRAMILAGYTSIPCHIMDSSDNQAAQMALIENIQRENLTSIEEATAFVSLLEAKGWTQDKLAQAVGKSQSAIANKIRLLQLPQEIQEGILSRKISERHARAILHIKQENQLEVYEQVIEKKLNVAQTEKLVEHHEQVKPSKRKSKTKGVSRNIQVAKNTIKQAITMVEKTGTVVMVEESDKEDEYTLVIHLKK